MNKRIKMRLAPAPLGPPDSSFPGGTWSGSPVPNPIRVSTVNAGSSEQPDSLGTRFTWHAVDCK